MKSIYLVAASILAAGGAAAGAEKIGHDVILEDHDVILEDLDGARTLAVVDATSGAFAIAAGREHLRVLVGDEAKAAFARLKGGEFEFDEGVDRSGADSRIIIHKMDYDEDAIDVRDKREVRIVERHRTDGADDAESDAEEALLDGPESGSGDAGKRLLIKRIVGVGAEEAAKFIDGVNGLDAEEKAMMKEAVRL